MFCHVCEHYHAKYSVFFLDDGRDFNLCAGCLNDLVALMETFPLNVFISGIDYAKVPF